MYRNGIVRSQNRRLFGLSVVQSWMCVLPVVRLAIANAFRGSLMFEPTSKPL